MAEEHQYCTFFLDGHYFGLDVLKVQEIIRYQEMTRVPLAHPVVRGLINLRGQIVTAIDLRRRLELNARPDDHLPVNVVVHTDLNCLSVIQFAVEVLKVRHIMVVGHYGCGGVGAALRKDRVGLVDIWLRHIQDVHQKHLAAVDTLPAERRHDRLCELNVLEQVTNVCQTYIVQDAWKRGQPLTVHGWIYGLKDGLVHDLGITVHRSEDLLSRYLTALEAVSRST